MRAQHSLHGIDHLVRNIRTGHFERGLSALTAAGALVTAAEIFFEHDSASFGNKMMWLPVALGPVGAAAGVAGVVSRRAAKTALPVASAAIVGSGCKAPTCTPGASRRSRGAGPTRGTTWRWGRRCWPRCWSPWSAGWVCWPPSCGGNNEAPPSRRVSAAGVRADPARRPGAFPGLRRVRRAAALGPGHRGRAGRPARPTAGPALLHARGGGHRHRPWSTCCSASRTRIREPCSARGTRTGSETARGSR